ncbi:hypothetical protein B7R78_0006335 [Ralstonia solanacearum]|uniref:hypothetical protein n=1 Tax=Ralstonia solanacearum TaxID=305 RepID=UPI001142A098|nr:hypothetical protein [Ralstonia solanacearum]MBT1536751.1 hypothetical protein [Ralstonia solanacearum]
MTEIINRKNLDYLQDLLSRGMINEFYNNLKNEGYAYAGWGGGVAREDSIAGISAVDYLTGSALMGMGGEACWNISP